MTNQISEKGVSSQRVYDAVCELHEKEQPATRYAIAELTEMPLVRVDDRLKALKEEGRIRLMLRGWYVPVEVHPPARDISKTILSDGTVKIDIGDELLTLTPKRRGA